MDDLFGPSPSPGGEEGKEVIGNSKRSGPEDGGVDRNVVPKVHDLEGLQLNHQHPDQECLLSRLGIVLRVKLVWLHPVLDTQHNVEGTMTQSRG